MSSLIVAPYSAINAVVRRHRPSHMLSLMVDPYVETPKAIRPENHLRVEIHDVSEPTAGAVAPSSDHIAGLLALDRKSTRLNSSH